MNLSSQITASVLCFLAQQNPGFCCSKLFAGSSSAHCFSGLQPPLCFLSPSSNLWILPTTYLAFSSISSFFIVFQSIFGVNWRHISSYSSKFPQSLCFISPCHPLLLVFVFSWSKSTHLKSLSSTLHDCLWWTQHSFSTFGSWSPIWKQPWWWKVRGKVESSFVFLAGQGNRSGGAPFIDIFWCLSNWFSVGLSAASTSRNVQAWLVCIDSLEVLGAKIQDTDTLNHFCCCCYLFSKSL